MLRSQLLEPAGQHDSTSFTNTPFPNPKLGSKEIFHLEAFVAKFMSVYKRFILDIDFDF